MPSRALPSALLVLSLLSTALLGDCFLPFPWRPDAPDVRSERLCAEAADPDRAPDTTFLDCALEGATFAPAAIPVKDEIVVMAWNILRGFESDAQLALLQDDPDVPLPDVLLLSEVDRGCRRTGFRNVAREYAEALSYHYVYATEFVELPGDRGFEGPYDPPLCEHGNAIVARYPLGNVRAIRHASNRSWYTPPGFPEPDEPRLGGRVALSADMKVGERLVRLYVVHLESTLTALDIRDAQAREVARDARGVFHPVVVGGDFNSFELVFTLESGVPNPTVHPFERRGFADAHASLPLRRRATSHDPLPLVIDLLLVRGTETRDPGVCPRELCEGLSDHLPVWTTLSLPQCTREDPDCDGLAYYEDNCPLWWNPGQEDRDADGTGDACA